MYDAGAPTADPRQLPLLLNVKQAAELLNVSDKHVRDLCAAGKIKAVLVGHAWRVGRDALLEQFGIVGVRMPQREASTLPEGHRTGDKVEIVIRIELPAELAERLADARIVFTSSAGSSRL